MNIGDIIIQIIGYLGAIGIAIFSAPEVINVIKTKKTKHVNLPLFALLTISSACFFISGFYNVAKSINANDDVVSWSFALAVAIANVMSFLCAFIVASYKITHKIMAKKRNLSEEEFEEHRLQEIQKKKNKN